MAHSDNPSAVFVCSHRWACGIQRRVILTLLALRLWAKFCCKKNSIIKYLKVKMDFRQTYLTCDQKAPLFCYRCYQLEGVHILCFVCTVHYAKIQGLSASMQKRIIKVPSHFTKIYIFHLYICYIKSYVAIYLLLYFISIEFSMSINQKQEPSARKNDSISFCRS